MSSHLYGTGTKLLPAVPGRTARTAGRRSSVYRRRGLHDMMGPDSKHDREKPRHLAAASPPHPRPDVFGHPGVRGGRWRLTPGTCPKPRLQPRSRALRRPVWSAGASGITRTSGFCRINRTCTFQEPENANRVSSALSLPGFSLAADGAGVQAGAGSAGRARLPLASPLRASSLPWGCSQRGGWPGALFVGPPSISLCGRVLRGPCTASACPRGPRPVAGWEDGPRPHRDRPAEPWVCGRRQECGEATNDGHR